MQELFASREYVAYFVARQCSLLAYSMQTAAISWQIFSLRHQTLDLGLVGLELFLIQFILALPAGILADRVDRRTVCIGAAIGQAGGMAAFLALTLEGVRAPLLSFAAVGIVGIAHAIGAPAERSLLANIVRSAHFVRAQALASSIGQVVTVVGPALAGILIAVRTPFAFGVAGCFAVVTAVGFSFLRPRRSEHDGLPLLRAALDGVRFIWARKIVLGAISLDLFAVLFGGATALLPAYATQILHVGPTGFGMLRSAPAIGAALVAAIIARHPLERRAGPMLLWCVAAFGVATIVFGLSRNVVLSLVALAATGGFDMVSVVIRQALVQLGTPNAMRGRVSAVENIFIGASNELGEFESGTLAAVIGTEASVVIGGVATLLVIATWTLLFPVLRTLDRLRAESHGAAKPQPYEPSSGSHASR